MTKLDIMVIVSFVLTLLSADFFNFYTTAQQIEDQTLRLHILANSDSEGDQAVKLAVRDALLEGTGDLFTTSHSSEQAILTANSHIPLIESIAQQTLAEHGFDDTVNVYTTNMFFNTTAYEDFTMPAGYYDAVRIEIGEAEGENWWCVLFPPLCIPSSQGETTVEEMFNEDQLDLIESEYDIRFKSLEIIETIFKD